MLQDRFMRQLRLKYNISQVELSTAVGISRRFLHVLETSVEVNPKYLARMQHGFETVVERRCEQFHLLEHDYKTYRDHLLEPWKEDFA